MQGFAYPFTYFFSLITVWQSAFTPHHLKWLLIKTLVVIAPYTPPDSLYYWFKRHDICCFSSWKCHSKHFFSLRLHEQQFTGQLCILVISCFLRVKLEWIFYLSGIDSISDQTKIEQCRLHMNKINDIKKHLKVSLLLSKCSLDIKSKI